jgi:hypothetical protein
MVNVVIFPKRCPHCKTAMGSVRKFSCEWLECRDMGCPFLTAQVGAVDPVTGWAAQLGDASPYIYAYRTR